MTSELLAVLVGASLTLIALAVVGLAVLLWFHLRLKRNHDDLTFQVFRLDEVLSQHLEMDPEWEKGEAPEEEGEGRNGRRW